MLIVVVVVVIHVVFVKNMLGMLGPKKFWLKKNPCPKKLKQTIFGSKRVRSKKVVVQKNVVQKVQKYFWSK